MYSTAGDVSDAVLKARRENFPVASRLLPRRHRRHLLAVYGFARFVDDLGDDVGHDTGDELGPDDRLRLLDVVEADVGRLYDGRTPHLSVVQALTPTVADCGLPAEPLCRLIEANRHDQKVTRYATFDDLLGYCELSANPVGHIVLQVFGAATPPRLALSDRVCSALQILEHCQDVGEDYRRRGRVYLPADDLRRHGCADDDLAEAPAPARLRRVVALQAGRARRLLEAGDPLTASLGGFARVAVAGYVAGGRATAAALKRADHEVLCRTVRPHTGRLLVEWLRVLTARREAVR